MRRLTVVSLLSLIPSLALAASPERTLIFEAQLGESRLLKGAVSEGDPFLFSGRFDTAPLDGETVGFLAKVDGKSVTIEVRSLRQEEAWKDGRYLGELVLTPGQTAPAGEAGLPYPFRILEVRER